MEQQRPFFRATVGELESLYRQHPYNKKVLTKLEKELALRKAKSARRLHALVRERLDEIRQKDGRGRLLSPVVQKPQRRPVMQGSLLEDTPQAAKETPENRPPQKPEPRQEPPQKAPQEAQPLAPQPAEHKPPAEENTTKGSLWPPAPMIIAVVICLVCLCFVILSTWDKTPFGSPRSAYEEQVRNLLN